MEKHLNDNNSLQGVDLSNGRLEYDAGFWSKLDKLMGPYDIEHVHRYEREAEVSEEKRLNDKGVTNNVLNWLKDLNIPLRMLNTYIKDIQESFKENHEFLVRYSVDGPESKQESVSHYLMSEYEPSDEQDVRYFIIKYKVKRKIVHDKNDCEYLVDTYYLISKVGFRTKD